MATKDKIASKVNARLKSTISKLSIENAEVHEALVLVRDQYSVANQQRAEALDKLTKANNECHDREKLIHELRNELSSNKRAMHEHQSNLCEEITMLRKMIYRLANCDSSVATKINI